MLEQRSCGLLACLLLGACTSGRDILLCTDTYSPPRLDAFTLLTDTVYVATAPDTLVIQLRLDNWVIHPLYDSSVGLSAIPPGGERVGFGALLPAFGPADGFGFPIPAGTAPGRWRIAALDAWYLVTKCPHNTGAVHAFSAAEIAAVGGDTIFEVVR